jgi:hypothetical protein
MVLNLIKRNKARLEVLVLASKFAQQDRLCDLHVVVWYRNHLAGDEARTSCWIWLGPVDV